MATLGVERHNQRVRLAMAQSKTLLIKQGRWYRTKGGEKVKCVAEIPGHECRFVGVMLPSKSRRPYFVNVNGETAEDDRQWSIDYEIQREEHVWIDAANHVYKSLAEVPDDLHVDKYKLIV